MRTHYDDLGVARDALPEVIRSAYKELARKFHPDWNPDLSDAAEVMAAVNGAYEVLSDPERRADYDRTIARQEGTARPVVDRRSSTEAPPPRAHAWPIFALFFALCFFGFAAFLLWTWATGPGTLSRDAGRPKTAPAQFVRPSRAPNGQPWPERAGYLNGSPQLNGEGLCSVIVDNSKNSADVLAKLVSLDLGRADVVRQFYVPAYGKFTVEKVKPGSYDLRHRDLRSGEMSRSEPFLLEERATYEGKQYSIVRMTLYKVSGGNVKSYGLSEGEF